MKAKEAKVILPKPEKPIGAFASETEFLAAKKKQFQAVFGQVDWEKAKAQ
ncbi:hypothetical protein [Hymenobacter gummosus]|nr:hypothetical protein [Hymenobacter gummosus]